MDIYAAIDEDLEAATESLQLHKNKTELQRFYDGKTILVTGATGFIGMLLIEKLLRSCSSLKKIILVLREKKGKPIEQRISELFEDTLYQKMRYENPDYRLKVDIVTGCCEQPSFGLDKTTIARIQDEVDIIFHIAASIRFDDHIRKAYSVNVNGTKELLNIAVGMRHLMSFVYVSTAFSQSHLSHIEEKFYPAAWHDNELQHILKELDDPTLSLLKPKILDGRANTYTLTKGMAEEIVGSYRHKLPVAVYRPSIVTATFSDPLVCWINNIAGVTGLFAGVAIGFIRVMLNDPGITAELIPADCVTSGLLTVPFHMQKSIQISSPNNSMTEPVYNFVANPKLIWKETRGYLTAAGHHLDEAVSDKMLGMIHISMEKNYYYWVLKYYILHLLPALFFVIFEKIMKQKPRIWNGYIKFYWLTLTFSYFTFKTWKFDDSNTIKLFDTLGEEDKLLFNCNTNIDWSGYFFYMTRGGGKYLLDIDWNSSKKYASLRYMVLFIVDKIVIYFCKGLFYYTLFKITYYLIHGFMTHYLQSEYFS